MRLFDWSLKAPALAVVTMVMAGAVAGCQMAYLSNTPKASSPAPKNTSKGSSLSTTLNTGASSEEVAHPTAAEAVAPAKQPLSQADLKLLKLLAPQAHITSDNIPNIALALVETTSKALLNSGQIDFALSVDIDLPVKAKRFGLDQALSSDGEGPRHVLIFEVAQAKASRRVLSLKPVFSTVFLGFEGNSYSVAADDPIAGQSFSQNRGNNHNKANTYVNADQSLGPPLIFDYSFDIANIQARRLMTVNAYYVDRIARTYVKSTFDISEQHRFEVAYHISRYDPKRRQHAKKYKKEKDVDEFERADLEVKLSSLLKDYAAKRGEAQTYNNPTELRQALLADRNIILDAANANTFDARPLNDPRFDSVVAIYTGKQSLGSGFYVTPDVVMTNWHVVKEHSFVEMKTYDGRETFGTILGKDARLDIALVRVQNRGRPVAFHTGQKINLGQSVEAIGHPHGFEFTITRGVISALRKHFSINMPKGAGDKVLYIQTDAPINPGNSGGPLFLGEKVVGMNTWGYNHSIADGLAFSVHYSEMMNFMNEHLPEYFVSPADES